MKIQILIILLIAIADLSSSNPSKCARIPDGTGSNKSPPDGRFRLRIINDPVRYIPGETYKISLEGVTRFSSPSPQKFVGFFLTVERNNDEKTPFSRYEEDDLGSFTILYPALSKISEKCPNVVVNTNSVPKSDVLIEWTAPTSGKGCITLKSTIIEHRDIWFMDDGALSKQLCEDEADSIDPDYIVAECTACDEAKYELTFEGLWSRNTHPKDFPDDGWRTKFSDVIGASHAIDNHFWRYGNHSSPGMKEMAEFGATGLLEEELKNKGESIRTIIKARGISYPNVNGKTFAVFRVDSEHHLISVVSKLYPSPDWFVGVSDLELCLANGQWAEQKEVNLYPFDAGTDSGATYTAPDQPTRPQESIRRIKPNNPNDPRSPFYDPENLEMKPLAKLYITRQRLYEKNCDRNENGDENGNYGKGRTGDDDDDDNVDDRNNNYNNRREDQEKDRTDYCVTNPWGPWKDCNNPCGEGIQERRRYYKDPLIAHKTGCKEDLEEKKSCTGTRGCTSSTPNVRTDDNDDKHKEEDENGSQEEGADDDGEEEEQEVDKKDKECQVTDWKEEECSCQSGQPKKQINRKFRNSRNYKRCMNKYPKLLLEKFDDCPRTDCNDDGESRPKPVGINCPIDDWTQYSQCSSTKGMGIQIRVRKPKQNIRNSDENLKRIVNMYEKLKRSKFVRRNDDEDDDDITTLNVTTAADPSHACFGVQFVESRVCGRQNKAYDDDPKYFCMQTPLMQKCKEPAEIRYFYSHQLRRCATFLYTGCEVSKNNFEALANCTETCNKQELYGDEELALIHVGNLVQERIDCVMTPWEYTPCNATCGEGFRWKFRKVVVHPQNGGKPCPRNVRKLEKCKISDCELVTRVQYQYFPPIRVITTTRNPTPYCEYSDWSAWSPCSKSCGPSAVQIRTRALLNIENTGFCHDRLEQRKCNLMPCLSQNYNYRPQSSYNSY